MNTAAGGCLCGAVRFKAQNVPDTCAVCHCEMCRRWTGSSLVEVTIATDDVTWSGTDHIAIRQSSGWAERAWCRDCGSGLYFRVTMPGEWFGNYDMPLGIFDDPNGFTMTHEIYIDHKPDSFAYAGDGRKQLTRADCVAKFSLLDSNSSGPL